MSQPSEEATTKAVVAAAEMVRTRGPAVLADLNQLRAALRDVLPGERTAIDVLVGQLAAVPPGDRAQTLAVLRGGTPAGFAEPTRTASEPPLVSDPHTSSASVWTPRRSKVLLAAGGLLVVGLILALALRSPAPPVPPGPTPPVVTSVVTSVVTDPGESAPATVAEALHQAFTETIADTWQCQPASQENYVAGIRYAEECTLGSDSSVTAVFNLWVSAAAEAQNTDDLRAAKKDTAGYSESPWQLGETTCGTKLVYNYDGGGVALIGYYDDAPYSYALFAPSRDRAEQVWQDSDLFPLSIASDLPAPPA